VTDRDEVRDQLYHTAMDMLGGRPVVAPAHPPSPAA
jgi:hypothetical protein